MDFNILFLGGAKRVSMARKFKATAKDAGDHMKIFGYELTKQVPLAIEGEIFIGKRWNDPEVVNHIIQLCRENHIRIVVPFVDAAVDVAARVVMASKSTGFEIFAPVGSRVMSNAMFDKVFADEVFRKSNLPVPFRFESGIAECTLIAKPRFGSASKGIIIINDDTTFNRVMEHSNDYLIQEYIANRREYTADCYVSIIDGRVLACVVRRRDEVAGGEVVRTTVIHHPQAEELVLSTLRATGLRGAVTVQLIEDIDKHHLMVMEVNPRLGGGAVASVCAGVDIPRFIMSDSINLISLPAQPPKKIIVTRFLEETYFDSNEQ